MDPLLTFSDILKVQRIVKTIAYNLNAADYLSFKQLNKTIYNEHLTGTAENKYWEYKLRRIGLKPESGAAKDLLIECDACNVFDSLSTYDPNDPKKTYAEYYKCLNPFINKLYYNNVSNFFPESISDPLMQALVLKSIQKFNASNDNDWDLYKMVEENLKIFREVFINTVIRELDICFDNKDYSKSASFISVLLLLGHETSAVDFFKTKSEFSDAAVSLPPTLFDENDELRTDQLSLALNTFLSFLNDKIRITDILFKDKYPVIVLFAENFVEDQMKGYFNEQLTSNRGINSENKRFDSLPMIYNQIQTNFVEKLEESINAGPSFKRFVSDFIQLYLEPEILRFFDTMVFNFTNNTELIFQTYQKEAQLKQKETDEAILNSLKDTGATSAELLDGKTNFLKSFTKIFKMNNNKTQAEQDLEVSYTLQKMNKNLQNITSLISLDLCYKVIQACKEHIEKIYIFMDVEVFHDIVKSKCQELFKTLIYQLSENHIKLGFENALQLLKNYDANESKLSGLNSDDRPEEDNKVEPLVQFTELINIGDIILQMISIFYNNELVSKSIIDKNKDFLNEVVHTKKVFETMLDDYVADGLNIGIDKLMDQVQFVFNTMQFPDDFNPDPQTVYQREITTSKCAKATVELLSEHCFLLTGATDKGTIDVFQQEVAERFFDEVVKNIKKHLISEDGAVFLIADLNYYYDFIANKLKQKNMIPFFAGLKVVGQLYLISGKDSKELGKMICDVGKFQGVFTQEEIYELVQRRTDWLRVRKDVEKVMYGLGVSDCVIA